MLSVAFSYAEVNILSIVMLNAVMLGVVLLNVGAPFKELH
jgi:hypothetical protein